jgi:hypothetical protein
MKHKTIRRIILFIFICITFSLKAFVQPSDNLIKQISILYSFNFPIADSNELIPYEKDVVSAYSNWYKFLLYPDGDSICDHLIRSLEVLSGGTCSIKDEISRWFFGIYFEQYKSRILLFKGEYLKAYRTSINLFSKINDIDTSKMDSEEKLYYQFLEASRLYFMGYLQSKYIFLRPFFDGDATKQISEGLDLLYIVVKGDNLFLKTEASYLLMKIHKELEESHELSIVYAEWLISQYPRNIIFQLEHLKCLSLSEGKESVFTKKKKEILKLIQDISLSENERKHLTNQLNSIKFAA